MSAPVRAEQVIDGATYCVQVDLDPTLVVDHLIAALQGHSRELVIAHHARPGDSRERARAKVLAALDGVLAVTLTPEQAHDLGWELGDASDEPARCVHDEVFAVVTVDGDALCAGHARALDQAQVTG